jgi:hypothetical protein
MTASVPRMKHAIRRAEIYALSEVEAILGAPRQPAPSGNTKPSEADLQLTKRVASAAQILQIHFLDHVIVGRGFFSFENAELL